MRTAELIRPPMSIETAVTDPDCVIELHKVCKQFGTDPAVNALVDVDLLLRRGEWLSITGYPEVEALDISEGMLRVAAKKKVYSKLHTLALGGALPFRDGYFAGIVSAGVFTTGHVGAEALPELIRICRRGAAIVLTVKNTLWLGGFEQKLLALEADGAIVRAEETRPYVSMPGEVDTVPSRAVVLQRC